MGDFMQGPLGYLRSGTVVEAVTLGNRVGRCSSRMTRTCASSNVGT